MSGALEVWHLGRTEPERVIHRPSCRYAKQPYRWAGDDTVLVLAARIIVGGGRTWHRGASCCAADLERMLDHLAGMPDVAVAVLEDV